MLKIFIVVAMWSVPAFATLG